MNDELSEHLPSPSVWPFVVGGGIALAALGVVTLSAFCAFGALLVIWGISGWIGDLLHAQH